MYDAIIIGAGVAGSYAAYKLSSAGLKVCVVERFKLPREKLCAGGVSIRAKELIDFDITPMIHKSVSSIKFGFRNDKFTDYQSDKPVIFTVNRKDFDYFILNQGKDIDVMDGVRARNVEQQRDSVAVELSSGDKIQGRWLVLATGALDNLTKSLSGIKIKKRRGFGVEFISHKTPVTPEIYIDFGFPVNGYSWVFPRNDGYMVGCGNITGNGRELTDALMSFVKLKGEYASDNVDNIKGHPIDSACNYKIKPAAGRIFTIGEAAGLVDSLTGEGIYYAAYSADILANTILDGTIEPQKKAAAFNEVIKKEILKEIKRSYSLARFINNKRYFAYSLIYKSSNLKKMFFRVFSGQIKYSEALKGSFILKKAGVLWSERLGHYKKKKTR